MEIRFYSWLSRIFRILFVCKDVFLSVLYAFIFASFSPFVGIVVVESFSYFNQEIIAYWPIVIILTEHSLSSCIGTCSSKCWYLFIFFFCIRKIFYAFRSWFIVLVYIRYNIIIEQWSNFFKISFNSSLSHLFAFFIFWL